MSASTERLVEQIKLTEETLAVARRDNNQDLIAHCEADLCNLRQSLTSAAQALTEGKQILKD